MNDRSSLNEIASILAATAAARAERERRFAHLWRMTAAERVAAIWRDELSLAECLAWSARFPHEVPLIGKEFAFIVRLTPEWQGDGE